MVSIGKTEQEVVELVNAQRAYRKTCERLTKIGTYPSAKRCSMHLAGTLQDPWVLDGHWTDHSSQAYVLPFLRPWRLAHDRYLATTPAFAAPDLSGRPVAMPGLQKVTVAFAAGLGPAERTRFKLMELRSC